MPTYGDAAVKPGDFPRYKHARIEARTTSSPAFPIQGYESRDNIKRVISPSEHVSRRKLAIARWMQREYDLEGFRALLGGLSRGLYMDTDGGKGSLLYGTAGGTVRFRVPWNTYVAKASGLTTQNAASASTHNNNLATALAGISGTADGSARFTFDTHRIISALVDKIRLRPVRLNGAELRAVVLMDPRNMYSLRSDPTLINYWRTATPRDNKNLVLFSRDFIELDRILYLPTEILSWFRPTVTGGAITRFGCWYDQDPRAAEWVGSNTSNITMSIVLGAGALRRGRRKFDMNFTKAEAPHGKGLEIAVHWDDGWMRNEWFTQDGRQEMFCDSSFTVFNVDTGSGYAGALPIGV